MATKQNGRSGTVGRPRGFDPDEALERAMMVFWEHGYEGASLSCLTHAMGISTTSMYAAFGNKEELFRKALERYSEGPSAYLTRALEEGGIGVLGPTAVRTLLHFVYGHAVDEQTHLQAAAAGAIDDTGLFDEGHGDDFATGLGIVIAGIQVMRAASNL